MTNEELVKKIKYGFSVTDNMQLLYTENLPLIRQFIRPYTYYEQVEDLLQEAYFGLVAAVQHYEEKKNVPFMAYAKYWIIQAVSRYIEQCGSVIRVPNHAKQKILRYKKTVEQLSQEQGREPTDTEILERMQMSIAELDIIKTHVQGIESIDKPIDNESEQTIAEGLKSDYSLENEVVEEVYKKHSKTALWGIVERYTSDIESNVLEERYKREATYYNIGSKYGFSTDRARQIEHKALQKLRLGRAKRELRESFDIEQSGIYRNGVGKYVEHGCTSTVEYYALRRLEENRKNVF